MKEEKKVFSEKFVPTRTQWWGYYEKWVERIASALWKMGNPQECLDAAQDAILKVMGVHERFHLESPLVPKSEGQWYKMCYNQARGILSNRHKHDDLSESCSTSDEEEVWKFGLGESRFDDIDKKNLKAEICEAISHLCEDKHFEKRLVQAFFMTYLEEKSAKEVVDSGIGIKNANALFQSNKRILDYLKSRSGDQNSELAILWEKIGG